MATLEDIADALRNAHAAGDTASANKLADAYTAMQQSAPPSKPSSAMESGLDYFAKKPGWHYSSIAPAATDETGHPHFALPDIIRDPLLSAMGSANKLEHGQVPQVNDYMPAVMATAGSGIRAPTSAADAVPTMASALSKSVPPEQKASQLVSRAFQRDKVEPSNAAQVVSRYPDKDLAVMDAGGSNVNRLARTVRTLPGEGSNNIETFLTERQNDQHNRVLADIKSNFANGADVHTVADKLIVDRAETASPLYDAAFSNKAHVWSPRLQQFLDDPVARAGYAQGIKIQRLNALEKGEEFHPSDYSVSGFNEDGSPIINWANWKTGGTAQDIPNLRTLDAVKRGLDGMVEAHRNQVTGKLNEEGRAINGVRAKYVGELDRIAPTEYKAARAAYSGPSQSLDALADGRDFLKMDSETLTKTVNDLPASDRDFFRIGAARALQDKISGAQDNADVVPRVFGNKTIRAQIAAVFGHEATTKFAEAASAEKVATATNRFVRGGSDTTAKLADVADTNTIGRDAAHGFVTGGVKGAIALPALNYAHSKIDAYFHGMTPDVRKALADLLTRTGPNALPNGRANLPPRAVNYGSNPRVNSMAALLAQPSDTNRPNR